MELQNPHFSLPFEFVSDATEVAGVFPSNSTFPSSTLIPEIVGPAVTVEAVEQDSTEDLIHQALALFLCPVGYRDDLPEFGMPSPLFDQAPLDLDEQRRAIARWIPGVDVFVSEGADIIDAAVRHLQVNISESSTES